MFLAKFLGTTEGQAFVIHVIQDGTLDPAQVRAYTGNNDPYVAQRQVNPRLQNLAPLYRAKHANAGARPECGSNQKVASCTRRAVVTRYPHNQRMKPKLTPAQSALLTSASSYSSMVRFPGEAQEQFSCFFAHSSPFDLCFRCKGTWKT